MQWPFRFSSRSIRGTIKYSIDGVVKNSEEASLYRVYMKDKIRLDMLAVLICLVGQVVMGGLSRNHLSPKFKGGDALVEGEVGMSEFTPSLVSLCPSYGPHWPAPCRVLPYRNTTDLRFVCDDFTCKV